MFSHALTLVFVLGGTLAGGWDYFVRPFFFGTETGFVRVPIQLTIAVVIAGLLWGGFRAYEDEREAKEALIKVSQVRGRRQMVKDLLGDALWGYDHPIASDARRAWDVEVVILISAAYGVGEAAAFIEADNQRVYVVDLIHRADLLDVRLEFPSVSSWKDAAIKQVSPLKKQDG